MIPTVCERTEILAWIFHSHLILFGLDWRM